MGSEMCIRDRSVNCRVCPINDSCKAFLSLNPINYPAPIKSKTVPTIKVSTCIVQKQNKLLILQRPIDTMLWWLLEFPGGKIQNNESRKKAVIREVMEETSLAIKNPNYLGQIKHQYSHFKVLISLFLADVKDISSLKTNQNYKWTTRKQLDKFALPKANYKMLEILDKLK